MFTFEEFLEKLKDFNVCDKCGTKLSVIANDFGFVIPTETEKKYSKDCKMTLFKSDIELNNGVIIDINRPFAENKNSALNKAGCHILVECRRCKSNKVRFRQNGGVEISNIA